MKVEVDVLGSPSLISLMVSVDVKQHSCPKIGGDESHFNVSLTVRNKVTRQCSQTTTVEEKGEPKTGDLNRGPVLTSLTPYR